MPLREQGPAHLSGPPECACPGEGQEDGGDGL
jgi:hypothetical protein